MPAWVDALPAAGGPQQPALMPHGDQGPTGFAPLLTALYNDPTNILAVLGINDPQNWGLVPLNERSPVPPEAMGLELNPAYLEDLRKVGDCVRSLVPTEEEAPLYAEVPANFWLCEKCWGIWGRAQMRYTIYFLWNRRGD